MNDPTKPEITAIEGEAKALPRFGRRPLLALAAGGFLPANPAQADEAQDTSAGLAPIGSVIAFAGRTPPQGWLLCDGRVLDEAASQFRRLAAVLGTTYQLSSDPRKVIRLPNLMGRFPLGNGDGEALSPRWLGQSGGGETHKLTVDELPAHNHGITDPTHGHDIQLGNNGPHGPDDWGVQHSDAEAGSFGAYHAPKVKTGITVNSTGKGLPHPNMPPFTVLNYIIRYR